MTTIYSKIFHATDGADAHHLPAAGTGKKLKVAVFATGPAAEEAIA
jgi:hypothetical protein